jgi:hypothetical protein
MATIHPEPKLVFIFDDGEGNHYLRVQAEDGSTQLWPLTLDRALKMTAEMADIARRMSRAMQKRPE